MNFGNWARNIFELENLKALRKAVFDFTGDVGVYEGVNYENLKRLALEILLNNNLKLDDCSTEKLLFEIKKLLKSND
jgi:hypothetical protein